MPALSPTMTEGVLTKWLKREGDEVRAGDVIAEVETDKATMEVEAVDDGVLGRIIVPEGADPVAVNQPIAVLLAEGEDRAALETFQPSRPEPAAPALVPVAPAAAQVAGAAAAAVMPPRRHPRSRVGLTRTPSRSPCARRFGTPWPRRCAATTPYC